MTVPSRMIRPIWSGERVRIDRKVGTRVAADHVEHAGRVPGYHLDVVVEQHPVIRLGLVAVADRMPVVMRLRVLQDRDDPRRGWIGLDTNVGPLVQRPRIGRASCHPAFLAGGLSAKGQGPRPRASVRLAKAAQGSPWSTPSMLQAAERLTVSLKGIEFHPANIYAKLQVSSRSQLAAGHDFQATLGPASGRKS
jgi:hypothetical protein